MKGRAQGAERIIMARPKGAKDTKPRAKRTDNHDPLALNIADNMPDNYNAKQVQFMLDIAPPFEERENVVEMRRRFNRYLQLCAERDIKVSNQAAYYAIGIPKQRVSEIVNSSANTEVAEFLRQVKAVCAMYRESLMADSKLNPVVGIFWQKNYDGFRDQQEVVLTPNAPLGTDADPDTIAERYSEMLEGIEDKQK